MMYEKQQMIMELPRDGFNAVEKKAESDYRFSLFFYLQSAGWAHCP